MAPQALTARHTEIAELVMKGVTLGLQAIQVTAGTECTPYSADEYHTVAEYLTQVNSATMVVYCESDGSFYALPRHLRTEFTIRAWKP